jgi:hypothetical protein
MSDSEGRDRRDNRGGRRGGTSRSDEEEDSKDRRSDSASRREDRRGRSDEEVEENYEYGRRRSREDGYDDEEDYDSRDRSREYDSRDDPRDNAQRRNEDREDGKRSDGDENENQNKEEQKEGEEDKEIEEVEREPLIQKNIVRARQRSYYMADRSRAILEQQVIDLPEKTELIADKNRGQAHSTSKDFLRKLENDGVYKIGTTEGIVTPTLTRPIDLSLRQPYRTKVRSAILCQRINSLKDRHYKLELYLGKIILKDHPYFIAEDK